MDNLGSEPMLPTPEPIPLIATLFFPNTFLSIFWSLRFHWQNYQPLTLATLAYLVKSKQELTGARVQENAHFYSLVQLPQGSLVPGPDGRLEK